jgi:putative hydrolase
MKTESLNCDFHMHTKYSDGMNTIEDMILKCIDQGIKSMAITDHIDILGYFKNNEGTVDDPARIRKYLSEITKLRRKYINKIEVFAGAEISSDFAIPTKTTNLQDVLSENINFFSLFLIEGIFIEEPIDTSIKFRRYIDELGFKNIPVILAHPQFHQIPSNIFQKLVMLNIGFELNDAKFSIDTGQRIESYLSKIDANLLSRVKFTIGSDAHTAMDAGNLPIIQRYINSHPLEKFIFYPEKFIDFI